MAATTIGGIQVTVSASVSPFTKGMTIARGALGTFGKDLNRFVGVSVPKFIRSLERAGSKAAKGFGNGLARGMRGAFSPTGLIAGGLAALGVSKITSNAFSSVDAMGELSDKLGIDTSQLKGLQIAAEDAGISAETLERAMVTLNKKGMGGVEGLRRWITETSLLTTHQQRLAAATEMFGSRGSSMVRMLTGGVAALEEAQKQAELFGWSLSRSAVMGVERAMDSIAHLKTALNGVAAQAAVALAPYVEVATTKLTDLLAQPGRIEAIGQSIATAVIETAKFVADGIQQMVGAVLSSMAEFHKMIVGLRTSTFGVTAGIGYSSPEAAEAAGEAASQTYQRSRNWNSAAPWSAEIESLVQSVRNQIGDALAAASSTSKGFLGVVGDAGKSTLDQMLAPYKALADSPLVKTMGELLAFNLTGAGYSFTKQAQASHRGTLAFAESGSADSYRQQAAIRRQSENLQKKQTGLLEKIEANTAAFADNPFPLEPANFGRM